MCRELYPERRRRHYKDRVASGLDGSGKRRSPGQDIDIVMEKMHSEIVFEFHISRRARERYRFSDTLFSFSGNVIFADLAASRELAHRVNLARGAAGHPQQALQAGALHAMGLIDEVLHVVIENYRKQADPAVMREALDWFSSRVGAEALTRTLLRFAEEFPTVAVYRGRQTATDWLARATTRISHREVAPEELNLLSLVNINTAIHP